MAAFLAMLAAVGLAAGAAWGGEYRWPAVKVVDGDTLKVDAGADMPPELAMLHVRLRGVNTPEQGRACEVRGGTARRPVRDRRRELRRIEARGEDRR